MKPPLGSRVREEGGGDTFQNVLILLPDVWARFSSQGFFTEAMIRSV